MPPRRSPYWLVDLKKIKKINKKLKKIKKKSSTDLIDMRILSYNHLAHI
jgi:hypothetical protein